MSRINAVLTMRVPLDVSVDATDAEKWDAVEELAARVRVDADFVMDCEWELVEDGEHEETP